VTVHPEYAIGDIDPRLYSGYLEPIGNWVYGGIWNPQHPAADEMGFRTDLLGAIRALGIPAARLPGGNFVSGWDWHNSVGPKEHRRKQLDLAWRQYEPNTFGHDEYLEWARKAGIEPLYTLNLGTGNVQGAIDCIEYTNHSGGTYWSDLRRKNGYDHPHNVKTWYLGNEMDGPWQIHSYEKDPIGYGIKAHEVAKALKWVDPNIETVACGSSSPLNRTYPQWDVQVLQQCYETVDYLSLHYYHNAADGDLPGYLNASSVFEDFIHTSLASCDYVQAKLRHPRRMMLSFDEYGCSFTKQGTTIHGRPGYIPHDTYLEFTNEHLHRPFRLNDPENTAPRGRQGSEMLRTLALSSVMLVLLRHADRIKIGCMTGLIGSAIGYDRDNVWKAAAYYPFEHLLRYGRGVSILPIVHSPTFDAQGFNLNEFHQMPDYPDVSCIEAACTYDQAKEEACIFIINRSNELIAIDLDARGFQGMGLLEHSYLADPTLRAATSAARPDALLPAKDCDTHYDSGKITLSARPYSWNILRLTHTPR